MITPIQSIQEVTITKGNTGRVIVEIEALDSYSALIFENEEIYNFFRKRLKDIEEEE